MKCYGFASALCALGCLSLGACILAYYGELPLRNASLAITGWLAALTFVLLLRWRSRFLLTVFGIAGGLFLVECGTLLFLLSPAGQSRNYHYKSSGQFKNSDPVLGHLNSPSVSVTESKYYANGDVIFRDVTYTIDEKGRRIDPDSIPSASAVKHALFFGCSFTFGSGVPNDATLPVVFERLTEGAFKSYNFGVNGYGTGQVYNQLLKDELFDDISLPEGIGVYSFIDDHLNRSTPHIIHRVNHHARRSRLFRLSAEGALEGPFACSDLPGVMRALNIHRAVHSISPLYRLISTRINLTYISESDALRITLKLIEEAQALYDTRFRGQFYVILWPRVVRDSPRMNQFAEHLEEKGIVVLRVPEMDGPDEATIHPWDIHPSPKEYEWVAKYLYQRVTSVD